VRKFVTMARGLGSASCFIAVGRRKKKGEKNPGADHALVLTLEEAVKLLLAKFDADDQAEIFEIRLTALQQLLLARNTAEEVLTSAEDSGVVGLRRLSRDGKTELELSLRQRFDIFEGSDPVATWTEFKTARDKIAFCLEPAFYDAVSAGRGVFVSTNLQARARATGEKYERESLFGMTGMTNKQVGLLYELAWYIAGLYGNEGAPQLEPCAHSEAEVGAAAERLAELIDGSPEGLASKAQVLARWPGDLLEVYGMTEGGGACMLDARAHPDKLHTVGRAAPGHDLRLIDESGCELPPGPQTVGEVVGRSPGMMSGYHGRLEQTREAEWFDAEGRRYIRTGDVGRFDEDGFLVLMDRRKDMIISGGFNLYPKDLEAVLREHPAVEDAAVFGVPSARWGETPVACVVLRPGSAVDLPALRDWANGRLGRTQRLAALMALEELPRSTIGKVLKRELRDRWLGSGQVVE
jgi:hypothetical protein